VSTSSGVEVARVSSTAPHGDLRAVWNARLPDGSAAPDGSYVWSLTGSGPAGSIAPLAGTAVLDTRPPSLAVAAATVVPDLSTTPRVRLTWSSDDPSARFDVAMSARVPGEDLSVFHWSPTVVQYLGEPARSVVAEQLSPVSMQRWTFRVYDEAGNGSSVVRDVLTPYDDRDTVLHYSSGWLRGTASGYWGNTWTQTTAAGRTVGLKRRTNRIVVVGIRCSTCGRFKVLLDGRLIRTVDTVAPTTRVRQRLLDVALPGAPAVHSVQLVTEGTVGRPLVRLDALGLVQ
jgi:hypothetical protein